MTNKETVTRNIGLTFDFVNHLVDNPSLLKSLPDKFKLNFVESDFKIVYNEESLEKNETAVKVKYVKVKNTFELANR